MGVGITFIMWLQTNNDVYNCSVGCGDLCPRMSPQSQPPSPCGVEFFDFLGPKTGQVGPQQPRPQLWRKIGARFWHLWNDQSKTSCVPHHLMLAIIQYDFIWCIWFQYESSYMSHVWVMFLVIWDLFVAIRMLRILKGLFQVSYLRGRRCKSDATDKLQAFGVGRWPYIHYKDL